MHKPAPTQTRRRQRLAQSCSECRRRHQKCISRGEGPCLNCLRRYPPPECTIYVQIDPPSQSQGMRRKFPSRTKNNKNVSVETEIPPEEFTSVALVAYEGPKAFGGVLSAINGWNSVAVEPTSRNTELFHLFHNFVVPNLASIDGTSAPSIYRLTRVPWMIQSPLMPHIAILMASFAQGMNRREDVNKRPETLALKAKALALTNEFLAADFGLIGNDAMLAVTHLASLEFVWGQEQSLLSHMRGVKEMIRLKGGFASLTDHITAWVLIQLDYEAAIRFERDIYIQPPELVALMSKTSPKIAPEPAYLSPLLSYPCAFAESQESMSQSILVSAAEILDDISFLVSAITSSPPAPTTKIRGTASWLHSRLEKIDRSAEPTTDIQIILSIITLAAMVYSESISTLTPLSSSFPKSALEELYALFNFFQSASLGCWNAIPGVYLWVLLVACPAAGDDPMGRYVRSKMAATRIVLGLRDYNMPVAYLRSFWRVQRWIERERRVEDLEA